MINSMCYHNFEFYPCFHRLILTINNFQSFKFHYLILDLFSLGICGSEMKTFYILIFCFCSSRTQILSINNLIC